MKYGIMCKTDYIFVGNAPFMFHESFVQNFEKSEIAFILGTNTCINLNTRRNHGKEKSPKKNEKRKRQGKEKSK